MSPLDVVDLHRLAGELRERAAAAPAGRAARTLPHPVDGLRQTVIALRGGAALDEHESPGAASLLVLRGRVRLVAGDDVAELGTHQAAPVPDRRHGVLAHEDSVLLLSVAVPVHA
ncbi:LuxR family transcriptional regulator [Geodermatophilus sp. SYSU D00710]